ncbi:MAG: enoyl-ACP reductase [Candidatus Scalindua sp. AMX11]|nr:MAG: SDR family NAD(P)-dependent oxidoreductase [Candidatus Scalindua sp.]NOG83912.1 enoyl-ACP reductase [Planctomycetota bacterium]RZV87984.1 MAG: enoyl-ACP reductase [Candidatus Scalindua sp. SCAELEC01]TDE64133.1 MAG: enoyl-ACP reductase [Candidatus Scalindua sp. AMX11]GJQ58440.1 MAG: enoyl-[acyl-carrier-protein] reductase [NADH] [Candidatus Scalindua sp.]
MILQGKTILIANISGKRSTGWGIAQSLSKQGARIAYTYQNERFGTEVRSLFSPLDSIDVGECDVTSDDDIKKLFDRLGSEVDALDGLIHTPAFAKQEDLTGNFVDTSRDGFKLALDISCYSLIALCKGALPLLGVNGGAVTALTYIGGERAVKNYNVMGVAKAALESSVRYLAADLGPKKIRVNAISAGPMRTLAARGLKDFMVMYELTKEKAPLRCNIDPTDVGNTAVYLCSEWAKGVTGEIVHVDSGYHMIGI